MDARTLLEERARRLAQPMAAPRSDDRLEVMTFTLGNETYAMESRFVMEVFRLTAMSRLPGADPPVLGVVAWRGELLTVLDLREALGLPGDTLDDLACVIVVGAEGPAFGILANALGTISHVPMDGLDRSPDLGASRNPLVRGVTPDATLVLDVHALLCLRT